MSDRTLPNDEVTRIQRETAPMIVIDYHDLDGRAQRVTVSDALYVETLHVLLDCGAADLNIHF